MTDIESIKTAAIDLLNNPARTWGRSINQTLSDIVGSALVRATQDSPLASEQFEVTRRDILQTLRTPASQT